MRSFNPVLDAEAYQMELESRPCIVCCNCNSPIYPGEYFFLIEKNNYCEQCISDARKEVPYD